MLAVCEVVVPASYICLDLTHDNKSLIVKMPSDGDKMRISLPPGSNPLDVGVTHFSSDIMDETKIEKLRDGPCTTPGGMPNVTQSTSAPSD